MFKSDPFRHLQGTDSPAEIKQPGIYVGVVKTVDATTRTVTVIVPAVADGNTALGPARVMAPIASGTPAMPTIGMKVVVAFLNNSYDTLVVLGKYV
jgi:hypothetical protein